MNKTRCAKVTHKVAELEMLYKWQSLKSLSRGFYSKVLKNILGFGILDEDKVSFVCSISYRYGFGDIITYMEEANNFQYGSFLKRFVFDKGGLRFSCMSKCQRCKKREMLKFMRIVFDLKNRSEELDLKISGTSLVF
ncbi:hypothetical protein KHM19_11910 [Leptospira borgpetersenii]|uniref:Uncharacterized protein n=1 Tax=Leptospira borgpetersenii serovar Javanica str. UI 09931 TaxID=1049767 RepID=A0AAV3JEG3_LEPBO|nr:hypothetical protein [Leptospira borgpetersenii]AXX15068.1 hypothetical protein C4Q31_05440 [Leptospira borgpetersenii serovar Ceylonica]EKQ92414.1 hypothetical protein LEP1GSC101_2751 [Leptospira borgpetersenii str. UI 09149]EPG58922.1 hypothetical protein LEP1GSC103_0350 [Leptospira borgpetersenii serovar Javanica str. UI 09931]PTM49005.1 hypothetical protein CLV95_105149 [Leptospira borgpetersenii serovar Javanica]QVK48117.1 hypothetical protein FH601_01780 [Leptospira borgpetersenii]